MRIPVSLHPRNKGAGPLNEAKVNSEGARSSMELHDWDSVVKWPIALNPGSPSTPL